MFLESVFAPLPPALTANGFTLGNAPLLALGDKEALLFDRAQDAIPGHLFAKALEQALLRLSILQYNSCHPRITSL
jgi:hypothetical protein